MLAVTEFIPVFHPRVCYTARRTNGLKGLDKERDIIIKSTGASLLSRVDQLEMGGELFGTGIKSGRIPRSEDSRTRQADACV